MDISILCSATVVTYRNHLNELLNKGGFLIFIAHTHALHLFSIAGVRWMLVLSQMRVQRQFARFLHGPRTKKCSLFNLIEW